MSVFKSPGDGAVPVTRTALPCCITTLRRCIKNANERVSAELLVGPCFVENVAFTPPLLFCWCATDDRVLRRTQPSELSLNYRPVVRCDAISVTVYGWTASCLSRPLVTALECDISDVSFSSVQLIMRTCFFHVQLASRRWQEAPRLQTDRATQYMSLKISQSFNVRIMACPWNLD